MAKLPEVYRKSPPVITTFDWFDWATGAGYKNFYCSGATDSVGDKYFLSTIAAESDSDNNLIYVVNSWKDVDFDITFGKPLTVAAADCIIKSTMVSSSTIYAVYNIYHVDSAGNETSLGTATSGTVPIATYTKITKFALTRKAFAIGETLRVNVRSIAGSSGASQGIYLYNESTDKEFKVSIPFITQD